MGGHSERKILREVKRYAKVALGESEPIAITDLRLSVLANGFTPCPNRDKRAMFRGWNGLNPDAEEVKSWLNPRATATRYSATGLLIVGGIVTIDNDLPDVEIAGEFRLAVQKIAPQLFERQRALERGRDDDSPKCMLFCRRAAGAAPYTIKSHKWSLNPDDPDAPEFQVEIFASDRNRDGLASRQVGAHGPHSVDDTSGKVLIRYEWRGPSPADVKLADLPTLDETQALAIVVEADRILEQRGMKQVAGYHGGRIESRTAYDLDGQLFDGEDFSDATLGELSNFYWENAALGVGTRVSGAFTGTGGSRTDRCIVGWSGSKSSGHITIFDFATETLHRPIIEKPPDSFAELVDSLVELPDSFAELVESLTSPSDLAVLMLQKGDLP
jgi:hypothetical protein